MKAIILLLLPLRLFALDLVFSWDAPPSPDVAFYTLKVGTQPGVYTRTYRVEGTAQKVIIAKSTLYFATVTATSFADIEGEPMPATVLQTYSGFATATLQDTLQLFPSATVWSARLSP